MNLNEGKIYLSTQDLSTDKGCYEQGQSEKDVVIASYLLGQVEFFSYHITIEKRL
jgi:hypothetical protein